MPVLKNQSEIYEPPAGWEHKMLHGRTWGEQGMTHAPYGLILST